ncbi:MAG TPA: FAD:protein FMN transferase [Vicinamibacterales bacterium]|jgi:thiamine biosynthesis lipoprotein
MIALQHAAMATRFEIRSAHPDERYARQAARAAFETVDRLEQQLSRFVENSDIARINHLSSGESTVVGYETMQCLRLADLIYADTRGAFDVSVGTGFESLELVPDEFLVRARADGVRLDLGAIGKGYAVDRMAEILEDWEVTQVLVDAGYSSVLALDPPSGLGGWPLTLSRPATPTVILARLEARQQALGASGLQKGEHIWNARDRAPVRSRPAAWVSAPRSVLGDICRVAGVEASAAAVADALSTAFMVNAFDEIERCCRQYSGLEAWILEGEVRHFPTPESRTTT